MAFANRIFDQSFDPVLGMRNTGIIRSGTIMEIATISFLRAIPGIELGTNIEAIWTKTGRGRE